ncbi:MAG: protein kinase [Polyangiaceae bacterium]
MDATAPSVRVSRQLVCPKCDRRFEGAGEHPLRECPDDATTLLALEELFDAERDPMVGKTLSGRFTLLAKIGAGSMGAVYRARQNPVGRHVAIKVLRADRAIDDVTKARFLREARANSLLASPHTVTLFDFGESESGELYLAMELLEGESLGARLRRVKRLPVKEAVEVARQALASLAEAHAKGIVHRDLKPDNLFFARVPELPGALGETVKVLDFGIAKHIGAGNGNGPSPSLSAIETQAGTVFGTPRYMSPEQAQAKPLDARSDLYTIGVILYQMVTGRAPFTDDDAIVVMARHIKTFPKPPSEVCPEAQISVDLERAILRALAKDPAARASSAEEMSAELAKSVDGPLASTSGIRLSLPAAGHFVSGPPIEGVTRTADLTGSEIAIDSSAFDELAKVNREAADASSNLTGRTRRKTFVAAMTMGAAAVVLAVFAAVGFVSNGPGAASNASGGVAVASPHERAPGGTRLVPTPVRELEATVPVRDVPRDAKVPAPMPVPAARMGAPPAPKANSSATPKKQPAYEYLN